MEYTVQRKMYETFVLYWQAESYHVQKKNTNFIQSMQVNLSYIGFVSLPSSTSLLKTVCGPFLSPQL